jgi:hypothetical protein
MANLGRAHSGALTTFILRNYIHHHLGNADLRKKQEWDPAGLTSPSDAEISGIGSHLEIFYNEITSIFGVTLWTILLNYSTVLSSSPRTSRNAFLLICSRNITVFVLIFISNMNTPSGPFLCPVYSLPSRPHCSRSWQVRRTMRTQGAIIPRTLSHISVA